MWVKAGSLPVLVQICSFSTPWINRQHRPEQNWQRISELIPWIPHPLSKKPLTRNQEVEKPLLLTSPLPQHEDMMSLKCVSYQMTNWFKCVSVEFATSSWVGTVWKSYCMTFLRMEKKDHFVQICVIDCPKTWMWQILDKCIETCYSCRCGKSTLTTPL